MEVSQKTKNIVPDNLATPLLDIHPKKTQTQTEPPRHENKGNYTIL